MKKKRTIASVFNSDQRFIFKQKQPKNSPINSSTKNKRKDNDDKKKLTYQLSNKLKTLNIYIYICGMFHHTLIFPTTFISTYIALELRGHEFSYPHNEYIECDSLMVWFFKRALRYANFESKLYKWKEILMIMVANWVLKWQTRLHFISATRLHEIVNFSNKIIGYLN